jgi:hypothetical protein
MLFAVLPLTNLLHILIRIDSVLKLDDEKYISIVHDNELTCISRTCSCDVTFHLTEMLKE